MYVILYKVTLNPSVLSLRRNKSYKTKNSTTTICPLTSKIKHLLECMFQFPRLRVIDSLKKLIPHN